VVAIRGAYLLTLLWSAIGCGAPPQPCPPPGALDVEGELAITVDGIEVPRVAMDVLVARVGRQQARWLDDNDRTVEFVDHIALTQALYRRALQAGLGEDPEVRALLAMGQRELLASEYLRWAAERAVTPEVVAARYEQMPELRIPQLRLRHLRLHDDDLDERAAAGAALRRRLEAGAPFAELARVASADVQTAPKGGDLGWLDRSVVEDTFGAEVAAAPAGAVLGPLEAAGAVHLLWIEDRREAIPLEEIEAGLTEELRAEERERIAASVRSTLRVERP
jgi:parvulin-like peptidyl-prolyl isomerase